MRKIIVLEFLTPDGVIQAPGEPKEDTSEGFKYGGWAGPYFRKDKFMGHVMAQHWIDELWLEIFPITLGTGKRLFTDSKVSPSGVIAVNYKRAGDVKTASVA